MGPHRHQLALPNHNWSFQLIVPNRPASHDKNLIHHANLPKMTELFNLKISNRDTYVADDKTGGWGMRDEKDDELTNISTIRGTVKER